MTPFARLLEARLLEEIRNQFMGAPDNIQTLRQIRDVVVQVVRAALQEHAFSDEATNWVAMRMFSSLKLGTDRLSDRIIVNEHKLIDMPYSDIKTLLELFKGTVVEIDLDDELRRRLNGEQHEGEGEGTIRDDQPSPQ